MATPYNQLATRVPVVAAPVGTVFSLGATFGNLVILPPSTGSEDVGSIVMRTDGSGENTLFLNI